MPPNAKSIDLYELLPEAYRTEDAARGYPLRALLELASRQARLLHDDIGGLWDDFFVETCADWVIPYLGDLVGNNPLHEAGARRRADVAKTIYYRRRKGTLAVLEEIARDVTGWGAHAVEFFQLLGWSQNPNHLRLDPTPDPLRRRPYAADRVGTAHVRDLATMDGVDTPFDRTAHSVDLRTPHRHEGWWNLPHIGFFLWRLRAFRVGRAEPAAATSNPPRPARPYRFQVHPLGVDAPLFTLPDEDYSESGRATELQVPTPIRRTALHLDLETCRRDAARLGYLNLPPTSRYCGHDPVSGRTRSLHLRRGSTHLRPLDLVCVDLTDWERPPGSVRLLRSATLAGFTGLTGIGALKVTAGPIRNVPVALAAAGLTTPAHAAAALQAALRAAHPARVLADCEVHLHADRLLVLPGVRGEPLTFAPAPADATTVTELGLAAAEPFLGALSEALPAPGPFPASPALAVTIGNDGPHPLAPALPMTDAATVAASLQPALRAVSTTRRAFADAVALALPGERVLVLPGRPDLPIRFHPAASDPATVERLGLATRIAVDPRLGRLTFAFGDEPADSRELSLHYAYGFSDDVGGGPYDRRRVVPTPSSATASPVESTAEAFLASESVPTQLLLIDATVPSPPPPPPPEGPPRFGTIRDALAAWAALGRPPTLIRFTDDRIYAEDVALGGFARHSLALVAAPGCRPVLAGNLLVTATGGQGRLRLEGLWIRDQLRLEGQLGELQLLDCTLRPTTSPSVVIADSQTLLRVHIDRCITGPWQAPPTVASLAFRRSILDAAPTATTTATSGAVPVSLAAADGTAGPPVSFDRVTVLGSICVREIPLATETLFRHALTVTRRQSGCLRFSYVPNLAGDPTPRRFRCQPDLALENVSDPDTLDRIRTRLVPAFTSVHFGDPGYGQLSLLGPDELRTGAEDGAEIGAFHDLLQPQREANLRLRLAEYLPFGLQPGLLPQT